MEIEEEQYADLREGLGMRHAAPQSGLLCNFDGGTRSNTRRLMGVIAVVSAFSLLSFSLSVAALVKANDTSPAAAPSHSDKAKNHPSANNAPAPTAASTHHTRTAVSDDQSTVTSVTGAMFAECTSKSNFLFGDAVHDGPGGKHHYQVRRPAEPFAADDAHLASAGRGGRGEASVRGERGMTRFFWRVPAHACAIIRACARGLGSCRRPLHANDSDSIDAKTRALRRWQTSHPVTATPPPFSSAIPLTTPWDNDDDPGRFVARRRCIRDGGECISCAAPPEPKVVGGTWTKLTWQDAEKDAFGRCYNGLRGHLVEVTWQTSASAARPVGCVPRARERAAVS